MTENRRLGRYKIVAFVTIVDVDKARSFYRDTLGLTLLREEPPFALVFDANGIMLRLGMGTERAPVQGTVMGWDVSDIGATVRELESAGVRFERYENMKQDEQGIWTSPTGARVAWFRDPDGNVLGLSQFPELRR
jgi:catechol 2,3-dioxygenase-like lactoylglutathione lyase family enzyme